MNRFSTLEHGLIRDVMWDFAADFPLLISVPYTLVFCLQCRFHPLQPRLSTVHGPGEPLPGEACAAIAKQCCNFQVRENVEDQVHLHRISDLLYATLREARAE